MDGRSPGGRQISLAGKLESVAAWRSPTSPGAHGPRRLGSRFAHDDIAPFEISAVQGLGSFLRFRVRTHLDKAEAFRAAAELVDDDARAHHRAVLREMLLEPFFGC